MFPFRVLNQEHIKEILDMRKVIEIVEDAYVLKEKKLASIFPMVFHEFKHEKADMDIKSGHLVGEEIFGLKLVSWFGNNSEKNMPSIIGTVLVLDSNNGAPLGILSGEYITLMRTGAAGGIGAKFLARKNSEELLLVGSGHLGSFQILATLMVMKHIKRVTVYNANSLNGAHVFCKSIKSKLMQLLEPYKEQDSNFYREMMKRIDLPFIATENIKQAIENADIIITATPSIKPMIKREWVKPGTHFSCIGADMEGKQEIDEQLFAKARIFTDDLNQAINVGEAEIPYKKNIISANKITSEIGSVILGQTAGRISDEDITIFDSTGISLQDLLTAKYILEQAKSKNIGMETTL